jgi:hypothetical protein
MFRRQYLNFQKLRKYLEVTCIFYAPFFIKSMAVQKSQKSKKKKNLKKNLFLIRQHNIKHSISIHKYKYFKYTNLF